MAIERTKLEGAKDQHSLMRMKYRFENHKILGYVLDVGPEWFLLATVSDRIWFDGFECLRIADVHKAVIDPTAAFVEAALGKRGEVLPTKPSLDITTMEEILRSASGVLPLVTICRDRASPDACWIGRIMSVKQGRVLLREITPKATWDEAPTEYNIEEITRVSFGADYENALLLVGGEPPGAVAEG